MSINETNKQPTQVTPLEFDGQHVYSRVNWRDGITPIDQENLNKSDKALDYLLGENIGYVKNLIAKLNQEVGARRTDIQDILDELNKVIRGVNAEDKDIRSTLSIETNKLSKELDKLTTTDLEHYNTALRLINGLGERVGINESNIANLRTDVNSNTQKINSQSNQLSNISNQLSELKEDVQEGLDSLPDNVVTEDDKLYLNCGTSDTVLH